MVVAVARRRPPDPGHPGGDREHADHLAPTDPLLQRVAADGEQEDEAGRERGLDDRQRCEDEGKGLERPAEQAERGSREPQRPANEPAEERDPKRVLARHTTRLQRL